jgi:hypothetical protein
MGTVTKGNNSPATEIIFERVVALLEEDKFDETYPNDVSFIAADLPGFGEAMAEALLEGKPIVVVFPDGRERLIPAATARPPRS